MSRVRSTKNFLFFFLFFLLGCQAPSSSKIPENQLEKKALDIALKDLPSKGVLEQSSDGYIYLSVSNNYVHNLFPLIKKPGFRIPSSIQRNTKIGAHISVFYKNEGQSIGVIPEIGQTYAFIPQSIRTVRTKDKQYIILEVNSPELEKLRSKYHMSPKLKGHEYHITLAEKIK